MKKGQPAEVPHHEQQFDFTCGPASLMMIFKHFDKTFEINKENETDIWRESSLAPLPPTSRYGLAFSALKRRYRAEILTNVGEIEFITKTPRRLLRNRGLEWSEQFLNLMRVQFEERKARALELGLKERKVKQVTFSAISDALSRKGLPIMLTSARFFDDLDWAHWVVVTGYDKDNFYVNDSASPSHKGRRIFSREKFEKINGYHGDQVVISLFR